MQETIPKRRLRCPIEKFDQDPFFSLVDYRNNLFTSSDPKKIMEFYNGFKSRDELIEWMKERPNGASYIHEVEGEKDIIVVIPTADFNGKYARECRENIFKGLHMIFVESGEVPDPYFNIAHNANVGLKKALEYNPKWIVTSNDDMYKIDSAEVLKEELIKLDEKKYDVIFTDETEHHSKLNKVIRINFFENLNQLRNSKWLGFRINKIRRKFGVRYSILKSRKINDILFKGITYTDPVGFGIFSAKFAETKQGNLLDEIFINNMEESDLSLSILLTKCRVHKIHFRIGDFIGSSFGIGIDRRLRSLASEVYFTYKWESILD